MMQSQTKVLEFPASGRGSLSAYAPALTDLGESMVRDEIMEVFTQRIEGTIVDTMQRALMAQSLTQASDPFGPMVLSRERLDPRAVATLQRFAGAEDISDTIHFEDELDD